MPELVFLKLGGSLITDKARPYTPQLGILANLASQIADARLTQPELLLILGHGSGSFGHTAAKKYKTREGTPPHAPSGHPPHLRNTWGEPERASYWSGFAEVWYQASALNRLVIDALHAANVPALALAPVASTIARDGKVAAWDLTPLRSALDAGLLPVIYGDVVFDDLRGGTILSTEDLFAHLARTLHPQRILLAGLEEAVWADFPMRRHRLREVSRESFNEISQQLGEAAGIDVTGGMASKVRQMLVLVNEIPGLSVRIFSGKKDGNLIRALRGEEIGTLIR